MFYFKLWVIKQFAPNMDTGLKKYILMYAGDIWNDGLCICPGCYRCVKPDNTHYCNMCATKRCALCRPDIILYHWYRGGVMAGCCLSCAKKNIIVVYCSNNPSCIYTHEDAVRSTRTSVWCERCKTGKFSLKFKFFFYSSFANKFQVRLTLSATLSATESLNKLVILDVACRISVCVLFASFKISFMSCNTVEYLVYT